ncbi:hypothetical protein SDC9_07727 [bioreactor metagenome]|uniref:DNA alkylation repair enzyme n=1 Tax=bioreactor metagenome TaxID=1076179 RepID=A0A644T5B4_9ZZZZ|nr:DNA alkylation repair protein [Candidatus Elulimicrobiales bacterium]
MQKDILKEISNHILNISTIQRAENNKRFFRCAPGEYGEDDIFTGLTVPQARRLLRVYKDLSLSNTEKLLNSRVHEERLLALLILIENFQKGNKKKKEEIFNLYLKNIKHVNSWDLIDLSAPKIIGEYLKIKYSLQSKNCSGVKFLKKIASDKNSEGKNWKEKLWLKRIAIVSTFAFMLKPFKNDYAPDIIFEVLNKIFSEKDEINSHDLIQKASGWMLREYGKRVDEKKLKQFLLENFDKIKKQRTLLRYSIEKMSKEERLFWLNK